MKTVLKLFVALAAAAGVFFTVKHIVDLINNDEESKKRIAYLKSKIQIPTRAKNKASDRVIKENIDDLSFDMEDDSFDVVDDSFDIEDEDFDIDVIVVEADPVDPAPVLPQFDEEDEDISEDLLECLLEDEEA